jgi:catalase
MTTTTSRLAEETIDPEEARINADFIAFLKEVSARRYPTGPIQRFNQGRAAGCVRAEFKVLDTLAPEHRVGIFAVPRVYDAWIRFANASSQSDREKDVRGMAIGISGVTGENLTAGESRQDFVLNSHPVMVAANTKDFMELLKAMDAGGIRQVTYFLSHPRSAMIGFQARQQPTSHLDIPYFSATPYLFGTGRAVKYTVRPCVTPKTTQPATVTDTYLTDALRDRLRQGEACFDFAVQFQADARKMPIEDATVEWKEADSPWHTVARIRIPPQDVGNAETMKACEENAFNPWNSLADHRPLGSMNRSRREIYQALAAFRHSRVARTKP